MSDIRFNTWLHQSGTGGITQVDGGHVGIGTTNPDIAVHTANAKKVNVGIVTANSVYAGNFYGDGSNLTGTGHVDKIIEGDTKVEVFDAGSQYISAEVNGSEKLRIDSSGHIQVNTTTKGLATYGEDLTIASSDHGGITIRTGTGHKGTVYFSDGTSGDSEYKGSIQYDHSDDSLRLAAGGSVRLLINSSGKIGVGGAPSAWQASTISNVLQLGTACIFNYNNDYFHVGQNFYWDGSNYKYVANDPATRLLQDNGQFTFYEAASGSANANITWVERLRINDGNVGIGTVDPTASNITTALSTNTKSLAVGIVTCNELFVSGIKVTSGGHYADLTAAAADGMSHYFPGSSTTALISNLTPSGSTVGNPSVNNTADSYFNNYPYFDFYSGNANENGYRYTQTTAKWADGPFSILFWVKPMASTLESESTFVQLGDHPSGVLRCLYTVSTDGSRQIKTITIGDDSSANNQAVLTTDWNHWATTYDGSVTRYYLNGSLARSHTHGGTLDVGTGNKYFWIGFGFWNASTSNKASMSHMSDIGIWNAKALSAATISSIYNAKRTVVGY